MLIPSEMCRHRSYPEKQMPSSGNRLFFSDQTRWFLGTREINNNWSLFCASVGLIRTHTDAHVLEKPLSCQTSFSSGNCCSQAKLLGKANRGWCLIWSHSPTELSDQHINPTNDVIYAARSSARLILIGVTCFSVRLIRKRIHYRSQCFSHKTYTENITNANLAKRKADERVNNDDTIRFLEGASSMRGRNRWKQNNAGTIWLREEHCYLEGASNGYHQVCTNECSLF